MIALTCGDVVIWKPSSKVPLCAVAVHRIVEKVLRDNEVPAGVVNLVASGSRYIGDNFLGDKRVQLVSVTGGDTGVYDYNE